MDIQIYQSVPTETETPSQRRKKCIVAKVKELRADGMTVREIMDVLGLSSATVMKYSRM